MKRLTALLLTLAFAAPVFAQGEGAQVQFIDFNSKHIEGARRAPTVKYLDAKQRVKFERLLKLKKDFLPKLQATAKDAQLR